MFNLSDEGWDYPEAPVPTLPSRAAIIAGLTPAQAAPRRMTAFPGVKSSVRVPHHSSILVRWTGGPSRQEVEAIANRYQGGHFGGMEDIYRSARSPWCEVFGGADYVSYSRQGG